MADLPRVLTTAGAARIGLTRAQVRTELRRGRWRWLATGVLLTRPEPPTRDDWIHTGLALAGDAAALSGWDALRVRGLGARVPPGAPVLSAPVLLLTPGGKNRTVGGVHLLPSTRAVVSSPLPQAHDSLPGVRLAGTARAISDTATRYRDLAPVRALVTQAVQRGLCTPEQLAAELAAGPRNGSALLRRALRDVTAGAASIAEGDAVALLRRRRDIPPFEVNAPVYDARGRVIAVADLLWRELRAVLEVDSREFHFGEREWKATMRRHNLLLSGGFAVAHYPPSDIRARRGRWVDEVGRWLARRAAEVGAARPGLII